VTFQPPETRMHWLFNSSGAVKNHVWREEPRTQRGVLMFLFNAKLFTSSTFLTSGREFLMNVILPILKS